MELTNLTPGLRARANRSSADLSNNYKYISEGARQNPSTGCKLSDSNSQRILLKGVNVELPDCPSLTVIIPRTFIALLKVAEHDA